MKTRQITAEEVIPLRLEVLRPGLPRETAIFEGDELGSTTHWGAFTDEGQLVSIATVLRAPKPGNQRPAWQIRGMATSPSVRGDGYGTAVVQSIVTYVQEREPEGVIWCNAREGAVQFYRGLKFRTEGAKFEIPGVGPHIVMVRKLGGQG